VILAGVAKAAAFVDELNSSYQRHTIADDCAAIVADGEPVGSIIDHVSAHRPAPLRRSPARRTVAESPQRLVRPSWGAARHVPASPSSTRGLLALIQATGSRSWIQSATTEGIDPQ
jgi:hypothetical protein